MMPDSLPYPIAPETVTVNGARWPRTKFAWRGLNFRHPKAGVRTQNTLALFMFGPSKAGYDLHLRVPFWRPGDGEPPEPPDMWFRVRPRAEVGRRWQGRKVVSVAIEPDPAQDPPWRIVVGFTETG